MSSVDYWLQWQVPVCALIVLIPAVVAAALIRRVQRPSLNAFDLWIPCWRGLNPIWLLIYRALVFVFMSWMLSQVVAEDGAWSFYFYTQWTFTLVVFYFALATIISAHGCWKYSKASAATEEETDGFLKETMDKVEPITSLTSRANKVGGTTTLQLGSQQQMEAGFWGYLMQAIYQTSAGASMLTDIVFWCLLLPFQSDGKFHLNPIMAGMHSVNAVFLLLDAALNKLQFPWFGLVYFIFWSTIYTAFQWILHACGFTWWPYAFLELSTPWAPICYLAVCVIHLPCYGFFVLVVKAKIYIFSRLFPNEYVGSV